MSLDRTFIAKTATCPGLPQGIYTLSGSHRHIPGHMCVHAHTHVYSIHAICLTHVYSYSLCHAKFQRLFLSWPPAEPHPSRNSPDKQVNVHAQRCPTQGACPPLQKLPGSLPTYRGSRC